MHKKISIIIPTFNEEYYIPHLITDLHTQTLLPYEIIVIDGKSTDSTLSVIKKFKSVKILSTNANVAQQRNRGAKASTGEILIFLDADVRCNKNFLEKSIYVFTKKQLDIACPKYMPYKSSLFINGIYLFFNSLFFFGQKKYPSGAGSCIIIKKNIFMTDTGFDRNITYEDMEFIRRYAKKNKFGMLSQKVYVSDRRFKKEGTFTLFMKYIYLSYYFVTNQFIKANKVDYKYDYKNGH